MKDSNKGNIVIVEDEDSIRIGLKDSLEMDGFNVLAASDGEEGVELILENKPDLVILDLMLPKMDGYQVARKIRSEKINSLIIMLTAKREEMDRIMGFNAGADDYMVKPFSIMELLAKVRVMLKRYQGTDSKKQSDSISINGIGIDFIKYEAIDSDGKLLDFTSKELEILKYLIGRTDEAVSRDDLLEDVWGYDVMPSTRTVDNFIVRLRHKLEEDPEHPKVILSVRGVGYKFNSRYTD